MNEKKMGENIAKQRIARHMTPRALAEKLRVDEATIIAWETGETPPREADLAAIAQALGIETAALTACEEAPAAQAEEEEDEEGVANWSRTEQRAYWEKKWKVEHRTARYGSAAAVVLACVVGFSLGQPLVNAAVCLIAIGVFLKFNNDKMTYIESKVKGPREE